MATIARIDSRSPSSPRARACTSTLPSGRRLDRPGQNRQPGPIGGELAQQLVLRSAADDVDDATRLAGEPLRRLQRLGERFGQTFDDAAHELGAASSGPGCRALHTIRAIRAGMSPGARKRSSLASKIGCPAVTSARPRSKLGRSTAFAVRLPLRTRLAQQPEPHHVVQIAHPAVDAALVGEVREAARLGEHGRSSSTPTSPQVPHEM